jgi:hypothetical protein
VGEVLVLHGDNDADHDPKESDERYATSGDHIIARTRSGMIAGPYPH